MTRNAVLDFTSVFFAISFGMTILLSYAYTAYLKAKGIERTSKTAGSKVFERDFEAELAHPMLAKIGVSCTATLYFTMLLFVVLIAAILSDALRSSAHLPINHPLNGAGAMLITLLAANIFVYRRLVVHFRTYHHSEWKKLENPSLTDSTIVDRSPRRFFSFFFFSGRYRELGDVRLNRFVLIWRILGWAFFSPYPVP